MLQDHRYNHTSNKTDDCTIIIFGATGDLSKRKLIPALYKLLAEKTITKLAIIGAAIDSANKTSLLESSTPFIHEMQENKWDHLVSSFHYYQMDFHNTSAYQGLQELIKNVENTLKLSGNRIFYFATMPAHFSVITENLVSHSIVERSSSNAHPWTRLVYEKPFGSDLKTSNTINDLLHKAFNEDQIYRIDHFLGKELVGNIALTRFTNRIFEPLWNKEHITSINIIAHETGGIQNRGRYYDQYGALKDMVQSHLLQLLALTAMEKPAALTAEHIRDAKAKVLSHVVVEKTLLGQYDGYKNEEFVAPDSTTNTFAALKISINNERWQGVPFFLSSGKHLQKKEAAIIISFKMAECLLTHCPSIPNTLTIRIHPDEGIYLNLNAKIPSAAYEVAPISMDFCHSCLFGPNTPEAYEILLTDVIKGDQAAFVRSDEVAQSWAIIEQAEAIAGAVESYAPKSSGPNSIKTFYTV